MADSCTYVSVDWLASQTGVEWYEASSDMGSDATQRTRRRCLGRRVQRLPSLRRQRRATFRRRVRQLEYQRYGDSLLKHGFYSCVRTVLEESLFHSVVLLFLPPVIT